MPAPKKTTRFPLENIGNRYDNFLVDEDEVRRITAAESLTIDALRKENVTLDKIDVTTNINSTSLTEIINNTSNNNTLLTNSNTILEDINSNIANSTSSQPDVSSNSFIFNVDNVYVLNSVTNNGTSESITVQNYPNRTLERSISFKSDLSVQTAANYYSECVTLVPPEKFYDKEIVLDYSINVTVTDLHKLSEDFLIPFIGYQNVEVEVTNNSNQIEALLWQASTIELSSLANLIYLPGNVKNDIITTNEYVKSTQVSGQCIIKGFKSEYENGFNHRRYWIGFLLYGRPKNGTEIFGNVSAKMNLWTPNPIISAPSELAITQQPTQPITNREAILGTYSSEMVVDNPEQGELSYRWLVSDDISSAQYETIPEMNTNQVTISKDEVLALDTIADDAHNIFLKGEVCSNLGNIIESKLIALKINFPLASSGAFEFTGGFAVDNSYANNNTVGLISTSIGADNVTFNIPVPRTDYGKITALIRSSSDGINYRDITEPISVGSTSQTITYDDLGDGLSWGNVLYIRYEVTSNYSRLPLLSPRLELRIGAPITISPQPPTTLDLTSGSSSTLTIGASVPSVTGETLNFNWQATDDESGTPGFPRSDATWASIPNGSTNTVTISRSILRGLSSVSNTATRVFVRCLVGSDWTAGFANTLSTVCTL